MNSLKEKIVNKSTKVAVIGMGYVGLPLALEFAQKGFQTYGFDIDEEKIESLTSGKSYIQYIPSEKIKSLVDDNKLIPTNNFNYLKSIDCVIICVPTPLTETKEPDLSFIVNTTEEIAKYLHREQLVILESTTYPGTTDEVVKPILESTDVKEGKDFYLAFSPEREDPGNQKYSIKNIPKIVGGVSKNSTEVASMLYKQIVPEVIEVSSAKVAEAVKMLENIYRAVNIALVNELKMLFDRMKIDIWEVIEAAATKPFGFQAFYPGPGLGGHCIPIDPFYLSWKAKEYGFQTRFIELAGEINAAMPYYVVSKVIEGLNQQKKCLEGAKVLILGVTYKRDVADVRESPALKIIELLQEKGAVVSYNDPYIPKIPRTRKYKFDKDSVELTERILSDADCVLIVT
ncbi:MAG: nucleotide sugar dehydrogenase, partial [Elusimicrobiota bacterium]|nr:nucleotide sugar dehydrogenase [Elusimicrobiota bacterium]